MSRAGGVETASLNTLHLPDAVHFGLRALLFPMLRPRAVPDYRRRGQAAAVLFRWFLRPRSQGTSASKKTDHDAAIVYI